jgi:hypothetical protein
MKLGAGDGFRKTFLTKKKIVVYTDEKYCPKL